MHDRLRFAETPINTFQNASSWHRSRTIKLGWVHSLLSDTKWLGTYCPVDHQTVLALKKTLGTQTTSLALSVRRKYKHVVRARIQEIMSTELIKLGKLEQGCLLLVLYCTHCPAPKQEKIPLHRLASTRYFIYTGKAGRLVSSKYKTSLQSKPMCSSHTIPWVAPDSPMFI